MVACAINERMARRVEYLLEEVRVLREAYTETTSRKRIPFTDELRRRLVIKGKALTRKEREGCCQIVRPSPILAWFRQLAPERNPKRTWKRFIRSHWETLYACDFFAVETLGVFGTVRFMVFFVIELRTRAVHIAGMRIDPDGAWMLQVARNLLDPEDGVLRNATHLIHDRDPLFTTAWTELLKSGGVKCVRIPASSPNCNSYAERWIRSLRQECLSRLAA